MLYQLIVEMFRSHDRSVLNFHEHVNAIVGDNQSGKTNLLRAIKKCTNNRPLGFRWRPTFAQAEDKTLISITFQDNRRKSTAEYSYTKKEGSAYSLTGYEKPFTGFASDVPDVIRKALNLHEFNIQSQLDQPFLITSTGGEIAKEINKIIKTEIATTIQANLTTKINGLSNKIDLRKKQVEEKREEIKQFSSLNDISTLIHKAEKIENELIKKREKKAYLEKSITELKISNDKVKKLSKILDIEEQFKKVGPLDKRIEELIDKETLLKEFITCSTTEKTLKDAVGNLSDKFNNIIEVKTRLTNLINKENKLYDFINIIKKTERIKSNLDKVTKQSDKIKPIREKINQLEHKKRLLQELTEVGNLINSINDKKSLSLDTYRQELLNNKKCPYCQSEITEQKVERIIKEIL